MSDIIKISAALVYQVTTQKDAGYKIVLELSEADIEAAKKLMEIKRDNKLINLAIQECE